MIPKYREMTVPILKELKTGDIMRAKDLRTPIAKHFQMTDEVRDARYASGNGEILLGRISWALSSLFITGLAEKPQKGFYRISAKGLAILSSCTEEQILAFIKETENERNAKKRAKSKSVGKADSIADDDDERTPEEELIDSYDRIKQDLQAQILATILSKQPQEFERLVVRLLQAMGYGGEVKNSGIVTKQSNDGGIDGIIKEDILGFNHISIQAKRYAIGKNVGRDEVQSFVGAVAGTTSKKGVFITTADFTKGATDYVESLNGSPSIILINGQQMTEYIYDYGLGLQTERVLKVMKMDMDYWDSMENNK